MSATLVDSSKLCRARAAWALLFYDEGMEFVPLKHNEELLSGAGASLCDLHVVEWSFQQGCFHVDGFADSLRRNLRSFLENRPASYLIVSLCRSHAEASAVCHKLQAIRDKRDGIISELESEGEGNEG